MIVDLVPQSEPDPQSLRELGFEEALNQTCDFLGV